MQSVFITGISSGLGEGLTQEYLARGTTIYGISRRGSGIKNDQLHQQITDLSRLESLSARLDTLLGDVPRLDLVILNAGKLGEIKLLSDTGIAEFMAAMDVNVYANKIIMDWLAACCPTKQIVMISSGAAVQGHKGWGTYALSKAALNMLAQLYAAEMTDTHICAFGPGLVDTAMQTYIANKVDATQFPMVKRLKEARGTENMPSPREAARRMARILPSLPDKIPSGSYTDIRQMT